MFRKTLLVLTLVCCSSGCGGSSLETPGPRASGVYFHGSPGSPGVFLFSKEISAEVGIPMAREALEKIAKEFQDEIQKSGEYPDQDSFVHTTVMRKKDGSKIRINTRVYMYDTKY